MRINYSHTIFLMLIFSIMLDSCSPGSNGTAYMKRSDRFGYDLASPDDEYKLPSVLREISGISWFGYNKIACIQDEQAIIFIFDTVKEKISGSYSFGKHGDYEDIALDNDTAWVLESNGTLYKVTNFTGDNRETFIYPTALSARNDTEGLVYDPGEKNLLIACKNHASINSKKKINGFKAIYRFRTSDNILEKTPEYKIDITKFSAHTETKFFKRKSLELAKKLKLTDNIDFHPSGVAIHPFNDDLYVISATPGKLIVMNRSGYIRHIVALDKLIFRQPEGICFSPEGDLYISNEGSNGLGDILKFNYKPL